MSRVTAVRGDISPGELGITSMHSHTPINSSFIVEPLKAMKNSLPAKRLVFKLENFNFLRSGMHFFSDECQIYDDVEFLTSELLAFKKVGGNSICDASPIGLRINPKGVKKPPRLQG